MRRAAVLLAAGACALTLAAAAAARDGYCSPTGDYCTSAQRKDGAIYLRVGTFSFRGRVRICVAGPKGARDCHSYLLRRRSAGVWEAKVRWFGNYPNQGPGTYRVAFFYGPTRLGPPLSFRIG